LSTAVVAVAGTAVVAVAGTSADGTLPLEIGSSGEFLEVNTAITRERNHKLRKERKRRGTHLSAGRYFVLPPVAVLAVEAEYKSHSPSEYLFAFAKFAHKTTVHSKTFNKVDSGTHQSQSV
jgi:hypothetical protein